MKIYRKLSKLCGLKNSPHGEVTYLLLKDNKSQNFHHHSTFSLEYSKFGNTYSCVCSLPPRQYRQPVAVIPLPLWPSKDQIYIRHNSNQ